MGGSRWLLLAAAAASYCCLAKDEGEDCAVRRRVRAGDAPLRLRRGSNALSGYVLGATTVGPETAVEVGSTCSLPREGDAFVSAGDARVYSGGTVTDLFNEWVATKAAHLQGEHAFPVFKSAATARRGSGSDMHIISPTFTSEGEPQIVQIGDLSLAVSSDAHEDDDEVVGVVYLRFERLGESTLSFAAPSKGAGAVQAALKSHPPVRFLSKLDIEEGERAALALAEAQRIVEEHNQKLAKEAAERALEDKKLKAKADAAMRLAEEKTRTEAEMKRRAEMSAAEKASAAAELERLAGIQAEIKAGEQWKVDLEGWAAARGEEAGAYTIFEAAFEQNVGPLGVSFTVGPYTPAVVDAVSQHSRGYRAGVAKGDELLELRHTPPQGDGSTSRHNCTSLGSFKVLELIKAAGWPRTLVFRRRGAKKQEVEERVEGFVLRLTSPEALIGEYPVMAAAWGLQNREQENCELQRIVLADPLEGCTGKVVKTTDNMTKLALAARGKCTFVDKAKALLLREKAAQGLLIYNNQAGLSAMPAGGARTEMKDYPVAMLSQSLGQLLVRVAPSTPVVGWLGPSKDCHSLVPQPKKVPLRVGAMSSAGDEGPPLTGSLMIQCKSTTLKFGFSVAFFGGPAPDIALTVTVSKPEFLCSLANVERRLQGSLAVVMRGGGCGFGDKALIAQKLGASGIVVVNTGQPNHMPMMADPAVPLTIPSFMASNDLADALADFEKNHGCNPTTGDILARITYDDDPAKEQENAPP